MIYGTWTAYDTPAVGDPGSHFGSPVAEIPFTDLGVYIALTAVAINLLVAVGLTLVLRAMNVPSGHDHTSPLDYHADAGDEGVKELPLDEVGAPDPTPGGAR